MTSPRTDTGYYWCQVNDPSSNGVYISSSKASVFDTGTMTICSERQSTFQAKCVVGSLPPLICVIPTSISAILSSTAISTHSQPVTSFITTIDTGSCRIEHIIDLTSSTIMQFHLQ